MTTVPRGYYWTRDLVDEINRCCKFPHPVSCRWSPQMEAARLEATDDDRFITVFVSVSLMARHRDPRHHLYMVVSEMMENLKKKDDDET